MQEIKSKINTINQIHSGRFRKKISKIYVKPQIKYSAQTLDQTRNIIIADIEKINSLIDGLQRIVRQKVQFQQEQIIKATMEEINIMQDNVDKVVFKYNQWLKQKNLSEQIWNLRGQIDKYQYSLSKLNQQNKQLKKQNKALLLKVQRIQNTQFQQNQVLKKIMKKLLKQKHKTKQFVRQKCITESRLNTTLLNQTKIQYQRQPNKSQILVSKIKNDRPLLDKTFGNSRKNIIRNINSNSMNNSKVLRTNYASLPLQKYNTVIHTNNSNNTQQLIKREQIKLSKYKSLKFNQNEKNPQQSEKIKRKTIRKHNKNDTQ